VRDDRTGLLRGLGRWDLTALVINAIIGAGIFGLPAKTYALVGAYSLLAFVLCGALVFLIVLCFAEVGSRYDASGGPYLYAHEAFGPWTGFAVGWLTWLARISSFAALVNLFVDYLGWFVPGIEHGLGRVAVISAVTGVLTAINLVGVRAAALASNAITIGKLVPLALFVLVGLAYVDAGRLVPGPLPESATLSQAVLMLIFAFTGFESAVVAAGEMRKPARDLPFALFTASLTVALVYVGVQVVCIGTLPGLATSTRPLAEAALGFSGTAGAALISLGALVSILGTQNASFLAASRLLYAMAERGQMPRILAVVHARFRTPHVAIAASAAVVLAASLSSTFMALLLMSTLARLLVYISTCLAMLKLRRQHDAPPAAYRVPAGGAVASLALLVSTWLLMHGSWQEARVLAVAAAVGLVPYSIVRLMRRGAA